MALIYLYRNLHEGETLTGNQLKVTRRATSIYFRENLDAVGEFEITIPLADDMALYLQEGYLISVDNRYFGIIRQLSQGVGRDANSIVIAGSDLKGYLEDRVTLYPQKIIQEGLQGYDAINNATTEAVVKHFVRNNITAPVDAKRKIPGFILAPDQGRGLANDQYMSRFEPLDEVMQKNLSPQKMGYRVGVDLKTSQFVFDVIAGVDHTAGQNANSRIIFDARYRNMASLNYYSSVKDYRNLFYASLANSKNSAQSLTAMYYREGEEEPTGPDRKEQHLNVSVNLPDGQIYDNLKAYALKDAERYQQVESIEVDVLDRLQYGVDYNLGDFVTIQARSGLLGRLAIFDKQIVSVTHRWTNSGISRVLGFGEEKITRFEAMERRMKNL